MTTIHVDQDHGNDATGDGTEANPYLTIDRAMEDAKDGDTIQGTYNLLEDPEYLAACERLGVAPGERNAPSDVARPPGHPPIEVDDGPGDFT